MSGDHGVEHGYGEERVDTRKEHGSPCATGFEFGFFSGNDSERDSLTRPYNKPDIESHDDSQPHSDSDGGVSRIGFCSEIDERFDEVSVKRSEDDSRCQRCERRPTEPEERGGSDDFSDGGFLLCGNFWHGWNLHEVEVPQQADPHDSACDMGPAEEEGYVFACSSANISELREQQREQNEENRSCEDGSMKAGEDGGHIKFSGQFLILLLGRNDSVFRIGMQVFFGKFFSYASR